MTKRIVNKILRDDVLSEGCDLKVLDMRAWQHRVGPESGTDPCTCMQDCRAESLQDKDLSGSRRPLIMPEEGNRMRNQARPGPRSRDGSGSFWGRETLVSVPTAATRPTSSSDNGFWGCEKQSQLISYPLVIYESPEAPSSTG